MIIETMTQALKHDILDVFKVIGLNGSALALVTWSAIIDPLKVVSLGLGALYTIWKLYEGVVRHRWKKEDRNNEQEIK